MVFFFVLLLLLLSHIACGPTFVECHGCRCVLRGVVVWGECLVSGNNNGHNIRPGASGVAGVAALPNVCTGSICNAPLARRGSCPPSLSLSPLPSLSMYLSPTCFPTLAQLCFRFLRLLLVKVWLSKWRLEEGVTSEKDFF